MSFLLTTVPGALGLQKIFNGGYRRKGVFGSGEHKLEIFGPKALAINGEPPDTIADRSIPIRILRKGEQHKVQRMRYDELEVNRRCPACTTRTLGRGLRGTESGEGKAAEEPNRQAWMISTAIEAPTFANPSSNRRGVRSGNRRVRPQIPGDIM